MPKRQHPIRLGQRRVEEHHGIAARRSDDDDCTGKPPAGEGETARYEIGGEHDGGDREQRGDGMRDARSLTEDGHPRGVPVSVERGLREAEIEIGKPAAQDQLSGQQVVAFVPAKRPSLGVQQKGRGVKGDDSVERRAPSAAGCGFIERRPPSLPALWHCRGQSEVPH